MDGNQFDLGVHRGKVVLIDFWATWCGPCQPELPYLKTIHSAHPDIVMVTIAKDDDRDKVKARLKEEGITWPHILEGIQGAKVCEFYNANAIPRVFVIDRGGKIAAKDLRGEELVSFVDRLCIRNK